MKTLLVWIVIVLVVAAGILVFVVRTQQDNARALQRIERERAGQDTSRVPLLVTPTEAGQRRTGFSRQARELSDSAVVLKTQLLRRYGRLSETQEKRISRLLDRARELDSLSRVADPVMPDQRKLELYEACVLTYGAGRQQCRELRADIEQYGSEGR
jgi:hypothetical protein